MESKYYRLNHSLVKDTCNKYTDHYNPSLKWSMWLQRINGQAAILSETDRTSFGVWQERTFKLLNGRPSRTERTERSILLTTILYETVGWSRGISCLVLQKKNWSWNLILILMWKDWEASYTFQPWELGVVRLHHRSYCSKTDLVSILTCYIQCRKKAAKVSKSRHKLKYFWELLPIYITWLLKTHKNTRLGVLLSQVL